MLHEFDPETADAIRQSLPEDLLAHADAGTFEPTRGDNGRHWAPDEPEAVGAGAPAAEGRGRRR
jgi:phospholipid/cholesterol/gamma-HCH transport system ATP-binding protein